MGITYLQYLGINVSSCSILAFTMEKKMLLAFHLHVIFFTTKQCSQDFLAGILSKLRLS